jgi:hypothetical protein
MLERHLSDDQLLAACNKLAADQDAAALLNRWGLLGDVALAEELGPAPEGVRTLVPGYAVYYATKKLAQGRGVGWMDALGIAGDAWTIATLGSAAVIKESGKQAGSALVRQKLRQEALEDIARVTGHEIAEQAGRRELTSIVAHQALRLLPAEIKQGLLKAAVVDVTGLVKGSFGLLSRAGAGRASFRKFTDLEARVFMQEEGRVFVSVPAAVAGNNPCARFLNATAENAAFEAVAHAAPAPTMRVARDAATRAQQNLACWWAGHATDGFEQKKEAP